jgi:glycosyltransferase 2 family protein
LAIVGKILAVPPRKALRLLGSSVILAAVFWLVPFEECIRSLAAVKPGYFAAGIILSLAGAAIEANQLWMLLKHRGLPTGLRAIMEAKLVSRFYGQFIAGELTGSAVKLYRLAKPTQQWAEVGAAMVFVRLANTLTMALMGLAFVLIERPTGNAGRWVGLALLMTSLLLIGVHLLLATGSMDRLLSLRILARLSPGITAKLQTHGQRAADSYRLFRALTWATLAQGIVRQTIAVASFACLALSLDIHLSLLTIGWIRVVLQAVMVLPLSISGIGLREVTLALLLQDYGVSASAAVALAFLIFVGKIMKNSIGGLIEARSMVLSRRTREEPLA